MRRAEPAGRVAELEIRAEVRLLVGELRERETDVLRQ